CEGLFDGRFAGRFWAGDGCGTMPGRTAGRWPSRAGRVVGVVGPVSAVAERPADERLEPPPNEGVTPGSAGCEARRSEGAKPPRWLMPTDGTSAIIAHAMGRINGLMACSP